MKYGIQGIESLKFPPRGGYHEYKSLAFQTSRIIDGEIPQPIELEKVVDWSVSAYPKSDCPLFMKEGRLPTRMEIRDHFVYVKRDASPGLPWHELGSTKGDILDTMSERVIDLVLERIKLLTCEPTINCGPVELVVGGYCDPVRVFIKNEPHPIEKIETGRLRLISSVSIVDELIYSLVFRDQMMLETSMWEHIPSKCGMGLATDDQHIAIWNSVKDWISEAESDDVSGWDWCLKEWMFVMCAKSHMRSCGINVYRDSFSRRLVSSLIYCLCRSVFSTSDGKMYVVNGVVGIMKSGLPITAYFNSKIRAMLAVFAGATKVISMGDDCVHNGKHDLARFYTKYGLRRTAVVPANGVSFNFCSHLFSNGVGVPESAIKAFVNLLHNPTDIAYRYQFSQEYRKLPNLSNFLSCYDAAINLAKAGDLGGGPKIEE